MSDLCDCNFLSLHHDRLQSTQCSHSPRSTKMSTDSNRRYNTLSIDELERIAEQAPCERQRIYDAVIWRRTKRARALAAKLEVLLQGDLKPRSEQGTRIQRSTREMALVECLAAGLPASISKIGRSLAEKYAAGEIDAASLMNEVLCRRLAQANRSSYQANALSDRERMDVIRQQNADIDPPSASFVTWVIGRSLNPYGSLDNFTRTRHVDPQAIKATFDEIDYENELVLCITDLVASAFGDDEIYPFVPEPYSAVEMIRRGKRRHYRTR